jgi:Uri superfamily endonuclease
MGITFVERRIFQIFNIGTNIFNGQAIVSLHWMIDHFQKRSILIWFCCLETVLEVNVHHDFL